MSVTRAWVLYESTVLSVNSARRDRTGEFPGGTTLPVPSRQMSSPSVGRLAHASGLWGSGAVSLQSRNHVALRMALPIITTPQSDVESTGDHRPARQDARVAGLRIQVLCQRAFSRSGEDNVFSRGRRLVESSNAMHQGRATFQLRFWWWMFQESRLSWDGFSTSDQKFPARRWSTPSDRSMNDT